MFRSLFIGILVSFIGACSGVGGDKAADAKVLNIDDLAREYKANKAEATTKYNGKEFVMVAKAGTPLNEFSLKSEDGKYYNYMLRAAEPIGFMCMVPVDERSKFEGIADGAVVSVKGKIVIDDKGVSMKPCSREFRDAK
jgi:hypothetical protein